MTLISNSELKIGDLVICQNIPGLGGRVSLHPRLEPAGHGVLEQVIYYNFSELENMPLLIIKEDILIGEYWNFKCILNGKILFCVFIKGYQDVKWLRKIN